MNHSKFVDEKGCLDHFRGTTGEKNLENYVGQGNMKFDIPSFTLSLWLQKRREGMKWKEVISYGR